MDRLENIFSGVPFTDKHRVLEILEEEGVSRVNKLVCIVACRCLELY